MILHQRWRSGALIGTAETGCHCGTTGNMKTGRCSGNAPSERHRPAPPDTSRGKRRRHRCTVRGEDRAGIHPPRPPGRWRTTYRPRSGSRDSPILISSRRPSIKVQKPQHRRRRCRQNAARSNAAQSPVSQQGRPRAGRRAVSSGHGANTSIATRAAAVHSLAGRPRRIQCVAAAIKRWSLAAYRRSGAAIHLGRQVGGQKTSGQAIHQIQQTPGASARTHALQRGAAHAPPVLLVAQMRRH